MTETECLLIQFGEELNEVGQRVAKALRFGLDEVQDGQSLNNAERIMVEVDDAIAVLEMLQARRDLPSNSQERINAKKFKIAQYLRYSRQRGVIVDK